MRICTRCYQTKPESEYFVKDSRVGRLHAQCKDCYRTHRKVTYAEHYARYRELYRRRAKKRRDELRAEFHTNMRTFMTGKACSDCGESDIRVLELDHLDPNNKTFNISQAVRLGFNWSAVELEIKKCQILCANCHKRRTAQQFNWYKAI